MPEEARPERPALPELSDALLLLARKLWEAELQGHLNPSGLAQEAVEDALRKFEQFRGTTTDELWAWLRAVLASTLKDKLRYLRQAKRDHRRERSLERAREDSSARLEACLAAK